MKGLTVQQPWAWAIAHGGKNPELRSRATSYRGPLAIHAGIRWSERGAADARVLNAWTAWLSGRPTTPLTPQHLREWWERADVFDPTDQRERELLDRGAVIALAGLVDCHPANDCCPPWGDNTYAGRYVHHLTLADVRPLAEPVPYRGFVGLWTVPDDIATAISAALTTTTPGETPA